MLVTRDFTFYHIFITTVPPSSVIYKWLKVVSKEFVINNFFCNHVLYKEIIKTNISIHSKYTDNGGVQVLTPLMSWKSHLSPWTSGYQLLFNILLVINHQQFIMQRAPNNFKYKSFSIQHYGCKSKYQGRLPTQT